MTGRAGCNQSGMVRATYLGNQPRHRVVANVEKMFDRGSSVGNLANKMTFSVANKATPVLELDLGRYSIARWSRWRYSGGQRLTRDSPVANKVAIALGLKNAPKCGGNS